jgi:hypothetical protein
VLPDFICGFRFALLMADQPGGRFGFPYPNFTGATGAMTAQQFVAVFGGAMHNPNTYRQWISAGKDIRKLNPAGHISSTSTCGPSIARCKLETQNATFVVGIYNANQPAAGPGRSTRRISTATAR